MPQSRYHYDQYFFYRPVRCGDFFVYQLGELYCNETTAVEAHCQVCDEFTYIASGRGWFYEEGKKYFVAKGDCFLSFRNEIHQIESDPKDPLRFYYIGFEAVASDGKEKLECLRNQTRRSVPLACAEQLFPAIIEESWNAKPYCNEMIGSLLQRIILLLLRALVPETSRMDVLGKFPAAQGGASLVYRIATYLKTHIFEIDALSHIEEIFHYNYKLISQIYRSAVGETLHSYFLRIRMEKARQLLREGCTVTETAMLLGYSTVHPFSRAYKTYFEINPSRERMTVKAGK